MYPNGLLMGFEFQNSHKKLKLFTLKYKLYLPFSPFFNKNKTSLFKIFQFKMCRNVFETEMSD